LVTIILKDVIQSTVVNDEKIGERIKECNEKLRDKAFRKVNILLSKTSNQRLQWYGHA